MIHPIAELPREGDVIQKLYSLTCDGKKCLAVCDLVAKSEAAVTRKVVYVGGWSSENVTSKKGRVRVRHYCPPCTAKRNAKKVLDAATATA